MSEQSTEQTESTVKKVLSNEVKWIIGIITFVIGVVAPYYDIKTEIALIKENHFSHMETMTRNIETNSNEIKAIQTQELEIIKTMAIQGEKISTLEKNEKIDK